MFSWGVEIFCIFCDKLAEILHFGAVQMIEIQIFFNLSEYILW